MNVNTPMYFFFFKQKTAYELRISDWSSDVCSSDLVGKDVGELAGLDRSYGVVVRDAAEQEQSIVPADIMLNTIGDLLDRNYPVYERFLSAGINVLCHGTQSYNPFFENRGIAEQIDAAAKRNGVTFCGTGIWARPRIRAPTHAAGPCVTTT